MNPIIAVGDGAKIRRNAEKKPENAEFMRAAQLPSQPPLFEVSSPDYYIQTTSINAPPPVCKLTSSLVLAALKRNWPPFCKPTQIT